MSHRHPCNGMISISWCDFDLPLFLEASDHDAILTLTTSAILPLTATQTRKHEYIAFDTFSAPHQGSAPSIRLHSDCIVVGCWLHSRHHESGTTQSLFIYCPTSACAPLVLFPSLKVSTGQYLSSRALSASLGVYHHSEYLLPCKISCFND